MNPTKLKARRRFRRRMHVRSKIQGTTERPRLTVFRSSKHIYAQLIDDVTGKTLAQACSLVKKADRQTVGYGGNVKAAKEVGKRLAAAALAVGVKKAAFDRGYYRYHGRVKALADGAVEGGLQFQSDWRVERAKTKPPVEKKPKKEGADKPAEKPAGGKGEKKKK